MKDIILSVIVPVYNSALYLQKCIDSILRQTFSGLEIILVDDGSMDESGKICDEYTKKYENIRCIHKQNEGACYARRDGICIAKGEYIGFVDSDDWIEAEMYEVLMCGVLEDHADIVTSGFIFESGYTLVDLFPAGFYKEDECNIIYKSMVYEPEIMRSGITCSVCTKIYKKKLLEQYLEQVPSGLRVWEDLSYVYLPFLRAKCIQITHWTFYHYTQREDSTSHRYDLSLFEKTVKAFRIIQSIYSQYEQFMIIQLDQLCLHCLIVLVIEEMENRINKTSLKNYYCHIKEIGNNRIWAELNAKLKDKDAYVPLMEKRICTELILGKTKLVFLKVRAKKSWRRIKWIMIKINKMIKRVGKM